LLDHLVRIREDSRVWIAPPRDVDAWWRTRSRLRVIHEGGKWSIDGPGKERARLAFATLTGDTLSVTLDRSS